MSDVEEKIQGLLLCADKALDKHDFFRARTYLQSAINLNPVEAELHYRFGMALISDPEAVAEEDVKLTARKFRIAIDLNPEEPKYWSAYGHACLQFGSESRDKLAYKSFRKAARMMPLDAAVIDQIVDGFCDLGKEDDAKRLIDMARVHLGHNAGLEALCSNNRYFALQNPTAEAFVAGLKAHHQNGRTAESR